MVFHYFNIIVVTSERMVFTEPATHCSLGGEIKGTHSLEQYKLISDKHGRLEELRELGLTEDEIMQVPNDCYIRVAMVMGCELVTG